MWDVLTRPEFVHRWQYGSELDTTWLVGEPIRFRAEWQGQNVEQWGTVLEFDSPSHLRYSLFAPRTGLADEPENYFTMTYDVVDGPDGTTVAFIHEDPREFDEPEVRTDDDNPILIALRDVAEELSNQ